MAETNKSGLISSAEVIEELNADTLISVAAGAGEPQKNAKLSSFASALQKEDSKIPTAETMEFVRALDAEGKPILISKNDLATVVAGFMGNPVGTKALDSIQDCNNIVKNGIYPCYSTPANAPSGITGSCLVICFASESLKMQFLLNEPISGLYFRRKYFSNAWGNWEQISKS